MRVYYWCMESPATWREYTRFMGRLPGPRVAWFTPLPPVRSGIADYSAELLSTLALSCAVDIFVDGRPENCASPDGQMAVRSAHDFVWLHAKDPYDLVVYQLGNAPCHDYMWGYMARYPGLVVLHDGQLHHARGRLLRTARRHDDYQREFSFNHPGVDPSVVELGIAGRLHELMFLWPMRRVVVESARLIAVHSRMLADELIAEHPGARVSVVEMGVPRQEPSPDARRSVRARHGIPDDAIVFAALGGVTPEKRIPETVRQLAALGRELPQARLLIAGAAVDHYDVMADAARCGVADRVIVAGYVPHGQIADYLAAADVCLCLRWPTSRETSAAWLRCLAAERPTVVTDLAHTSDVAAYDPRSWTVMHAPAERQDEAGWPIRNEPACVALDILDEEHSLRLAMQRLAVDGPLRARLGREAGALWSRRFTLDRMVAGYRNLIDAALATPPPPAPRPDLPAHFRADGTEHAATLLGEMGLSDDSIADLWKTV